MRSAWSKAPPMSRQNELGSGMFGTGWLWFCRLGGATRSQARGAVAEGSVVRAEWLRFGLSAGDNRDLLVDGLGQTVPRNLPTAP